MMGYLLIAGTMKTIKHLSTKGPINTTLSDCSTIHVILKNEPLIMYKSHTFV